MKSVKRYDRSNAWVPKLIACASVLAMAAPVAAIAQDRSNDRRGSTQDDRRNSGRDDNRNSGRDDNRNSGRDDNRGSTRDDNRNSSRDDRRSSSTSRDETRRRRDDSHVQFTHSQEGRRFDNGVVLRRSLPADRRLDAYFPRHVYSYPHYVTSRAVGSVVISPFSFYVGVFPPYIERSHVFFSRPSRVFVDVFIGGSGPRDDYYLGRRGDDTRWKSDTDLKNSVYDLEDAFKNEDIALLAPLTDPAAKIAIFNKGHYEYSLQANDYLDMTRDFMRSVHTIDFDAFRVHYKQSGVYQVFAKHVYKDQDGANKIVNLCMILERIDGRWTLTQIDSTPGN